MHDQPLNHDAVSPDAMVQLDQRVIRALEAAPEPNIPADFATRVASRLPARRPISLTPTHYGDSALLIGILVTLAALLVLVLHATTHPIFGLLESFLLTQFLALAVWFSVRRHSLR